MAWVKKTAVVSGIVIGVAACFTSMLPTSSRTETAIAVFDEKNIEEAIKTAIQTANILTEEQKQLALMILNMKKLDVGMLEELMKRNEEKNKAALAGDLIYPDGMLNGNASIQQIWTERMGDIEDVLNGNATVYDIVIQEQRRQKAIHQASKETALAAQQTIKMDKQNMGTREKRLRRRTKRRDSNRYCKREIISCTIFCRACQQVTEQKHIWRRQWRRITIQKYRSKQRVRGFSPTQRIFPKSG